MTDDQTPTTPPPNTPADAPDAETPASLSLAATVAPLLVLIAVVVGCGGALWPRTGGPAHALIAVWIAPTLSLAGAALAFVGLRNISRSAGAVVGKPMGIAGLFIGIAVTVALGAAALMSAAMLAGSHRLAEEASRFTIAVQDQRFTDARTTLSTSAKASLSNAELTRFLARVTDELGSPITGASADLSLLDAARDALANSPGSADADVSVEEMPRPVWLELQTGDRALAYGWVDDDALARQEVKIKDLFVFTAPNRIIALRPNGPAMLLATKVGWDFPPSLPSPPQRAPDTTEPRDDADTSP